MIEQNIYFAFDDMARNEPRRALLQACLAIDGTIKKKHGRTGAKLFKEFIRENCDIIEIMCGGGLNLVDTKWTNMQNIEDGKGGFFKEPDFADIVYHAFRCNLAHGQDITPGFDFVGPINVTYSWSFGENIMEMPYSVVWGLLCSAVLAEVNSDIDGSTGHYFTWKIDRKSENYLKFELKEWWGNLTAFRKAWEKWDRPRCEFKELWRFAETRRNAERTKQILN